MSPESNHYLDRSGTLVPRVFFQLWEAMDDQPYGEPVEDTLLSPRSPTEAELERQGEKYLKVLVTDATRKENHRCSDHTDHVTGVEYADVRYRIHTSGRLADFIQDMNEANLTGLVRGEFAAKLRGSGLTGFRLERAAPEKPKDAATGVDLHMLNHVGRNCQRPASIRLAPNACPHCGYAPLICPACGYQAQPCPQCEGLAFASRKRHKGPGDKRLITDRPAGFYPQILDGGRWDGSDFIDGRFITKRALDWLLSIHAAPFFAEPVLVCIDGMSDEQKKWLERAKRLVGE